MTYISVISLASAAWESRKGHGLMRIEAQVQGRTTRIVMDLARELDNVLPWLTYGKNVLPSGAALPFEVETTIPFGGFGIELSANQRQPEHEETSALPGGGVVAVNVMQRVSENLSDLELFISGREAIEDALVGMHGPIGDVPIPPYVFTGRPWSAAWSKAFGPNFE